MIPGARNGDARRALSPVSWPAGSRAEEGSRWGRRWQQGAAKDRAGLLGEESQSHSKMESFHNQHL